MRYTVFCEVNLAVPMLVNQAQLAAKTANAKKDNMKYAPTKTITSKAEVRFNIAEMLAKPTGQHKLWKSPRIVPWIDHCVCTSVVVDSFGNSGLRSHWATLSYPC